VITLLEAAKQTGKGKTTLLKAIKSGRLSATKNEAGEWQLDPAEVFRVYTPVSGSGAHFSALVSTPVSGDLEALKRENELLRQQITNLEGDKADLRGERDRLLGVVENQTRLLSHMTERAAEPARRGWWSRFMGKG
jgi:hypothetical protein